MWISINIFRIVKRKVFRHKVILMFVILNNYIRFSLETVWKTKLLAFAWS